jgi:hypothetical protein
VYQFGIVGCDNKLSRKTYNIANSYFDVPISERDGRNTPIRDICNIYIGRLSVLDKAIDFRKPIKDFELKMEGFVGDVLKLCRKAKKTSSEEPKLIASDSFTPAMLITKLRKIAEKSGYTVKSKPDGMYVSSDVIIYNPTSKVQDYALSCNINFTGLTKTGKFNVSILSYHPVSGLKDTVKTFSINLLDEKPEYLANLRKAIGSFERISDAFSTKLGLDQEVDITNFRDNMEELLEMVIYYTKKTFSAI